MLGAFANAFKTPDLRRKILFVLFIVVIFRIGSVVPAPGVNVQSLHNCIKLSQGGANANLYNLINLFSGGALLRLAIFALGIMPYITASIILQLLTVVIPRLESLKKEGQAGQAKVTQYTRFLTVGLAILQSTAFVALATVFGTLVIATLGGYAFARFRFPLKNVLFIATLGILMVPYATILIPLYVVLGHLKLQNTLIGLALVLILFQLPFAVFMMRNAFESLPRELEEAALVDGCNTFGALRRILLHGVRPALVTVGLFAFLASWNDFFAPLILLSDGSKFTLPVAVVSMREQSFGAVDYGSLEAGVVVMAVPCVALFLGLQRSYVRGFTTGALRG